MTWVARAHHRTTVRAAGISLRFRGRTLVVGAVLCGLVIATAVAGLSIGDVTVNVLALATGNIDASDRYIIVELRAPRVAWAILVGYAFGLSGSLFQNVTRNALGSPDILGIVSGSATGALIAMTIARAPGSVVGLWALAGAVGAAALLIGASVVLRVGMTALIIAGIGLSLLLGAINSWLLIRAPDDLSFAAGRWLIGTLEYASWNGLGRGFTVLVILSVLFAATSRWVPLFGFTDDQNLALGAPVTMMNLSLVGFGLAFVAVAVWAIGPVALLAFAAPQAARLLVGSPTPPFYLSGLMGAFLMLAADLSARGILGGSTLPVGTVVLIIGGGFLFWLVVFRSEFLRSQG